GSFRCLFLPFVHFASLFSLYKFTAKIKTSIFVSIFAKKKRSFVVICLGSSVFSCSGISFSGFR
ncbi:unnamed protein product, partial [Brassica rapa subsp. trilocularis]